MQLFLEDQRKLFPSLPYGLNECFRPYTVLGALLLDRTPLGDWWEITLSIFLWMAISYAFVYLGGALVAALMMRRHPYFLLVSIPMIGMSPVLFPSNVHLSYVRYRTSYCWCVNIDDSWVHVVCL